MSISLYILKVVAMLLTSLQVRHQVNLADGAMRELIGTEKDRQHSAVVLTRDPTWDSNLEDGWVTFKISWLIPGRYRIKYQFVTHAVPRYCDDFHSHLAALEVPVAARAELFAQYVRSVNLSRGGSASISDGTHLYCIDVQGKRVQLWPRDD